MTSVSVRPVLDDDDEQAFFDVPRLALGGLQSWRPPPERWERRLFVADHNPLLERATMRRYVAERDGRVVGRIVAWVDDASPDLGFFGFFDVTDDVEAGRALAWTASDFCRSHGRSRTRGPFDFWSVCSAGVLVEGFDHPNTIGLHHGTPHYVESLEAAGYLPVSELSVWQIHDEPLPPPAVAIAQAVRTNEALEFRRFDPTSTEQWKTVGQLYDRCYVDDRWYFAADVEELRSMSADLIDPDVSTLVFVDDEPAAMAIGLKNMAETSIRLGSIIPPEPVQRAARASRRPTSWRQWLFGIAPEYRGSELGGLGTALWVHLRGQAERAGYTHGETTWTHALDTHLNNSLQLLGARRHKTYRVYEHSR